MTQDEDQSSGGAHRELDTASSSRRAEGNAVGVQDLDLLLEAYWAPAVRYAAQFVGSLDEAEDIAQEAFLTLWERRAEWRGDTRVAPLLFKIVRNRALMALRHARVREKHAERERRSHVADSPSPLELAQASQFQYAIARAVESLPPRQREIFVLSRVQGLSHANIAAVLDLMPQTVANQLTSALRRIREAVSPHLDEHVARPTLEVRKGGAGVD